MKNKDDCAEKLIEIVNTLTEEKNYIDILKGYCENKLEISDDYNKIYPIILTIEKLHNETFSKLKKEDFCRT